MCRLPVISSMDTRKGKTAISEITVNQQNQ